MPQFTESTTVQVSAEEAFDYVTDQHRVAEWNEHVQWVDVADETIDIGTVLRQHRRRGSKEFDLTFEVVEHDRPRRHAVSGPVLGVDTTMEFEITEEEDGTRVTMVGTVTGHGLRALLAPVVAREMHKSVVSGLAELRRRLDEPA